MSVASGVVEIFLGVFSFFWCSFRVVLSSLLDFSVVAQGAVSDSFIPCWNELMRSLVSFLVVVISVAMVMCFKFVPYSFSQSLVIVVREIIFCR